MTTPPFALLVPVKDGRGAKSRLGGDAVRRTALMSAFARDALTAAAASDLVEVFVVGDASVAADLPVTVLADEGSGDLNRALALAAEQVAHSGRGVAVLLADLPCLRTEDLDEALKTAGDRRAYVADAAGTGTTLLVSPPGTALDPRFGLESAAAHLASGAIAIEEALTSLRLDVDTTIDLAAALRLGVGSHTAAATADLA